MHIYFCKEKNNTVPPDGRVVALFWVMTVCVNHLEGADALVVREVPDHRVAEDAARHEDLVHRGEADGRTRPEGGVFEVGGGAGMVEGLGRSL